MNALVSRADEIFVRVYVETGVESLAVIRSGITIGNMSTVDVAAETLKRRDIQAAIRALRKQLGVRVKINHETIAYDLEEIYQGALEAKDWRSCIAAKEGQAKVLGLLVNKVQISSTENPEEMTTAAIEQWLRGHMIDGKSERVIDADQSGDDGSAATAEAEG